MKGSQAAFSWNEPVSGISSHPGSYALILRVFTNRVMRIGRIGHVSVTPGFYVYVGSAFGPGGVCARLAHHTRIAQRPHWHIDYLRRYALLEEAWYTHDPRPREHEWAGLFRQSVGVSEPLCGFGTSDCRCRSHLFRFPCKPSLDSFCQRLERAVPGHGVIEVMRSDSRQGFAEIVACRVIDQ